MHLAAPKGELMTTAFIFPGQGSQEVGMGRALADAYPAARAVFDEVDEALGEKLSEVIWNGPLETLTLTTNAQPALMATSIAVLRALEAEFGDAAWQDVRFVAGHSLGEYSALAATGSLSITEAALLLRRRGQAMQAAVPVGEGAMAALIGIDLVTATEVAEEAAQGEVCDPANDNAPDQVVISGSKAAVERGMVLAKERGAKRAILLPVSAPFHSALMQPAAEVMEEALAQADIREPRVPVFANVRAAPIDDPEEIRAALVNQVCGTVRWVESVRGMGDAGIMRYAELGPGRVLANLVKRVLPGVETMSIGTPDMLAAFKSAAGQGE
jgi:[acyl-carrier-protein] S-malonyltransferase